MKVKVLRANPAGNITLFVLSPVPREDRTDIAGRLMGISELQAEQVGFLCAPQQGCVSRMEMAGGEFCGNATRAFGMYTARQQGGPSKVRVEVSGCDHPVDVDVDLKAGTARAEMPVPLWVKQVKAGETTGTLVHLGGIAHLVVEGVEPRQEFFDQVEPLFFDIPDLDAYGVIFLEPESGKMTPLVKVPAANTLVWEGSCGSGSLACAVAQSQSITDGAFERDYIQPAGVVRATAVRKDGMVVKAYIGGPVSLDPPIDIEL